MGNNSLGVFYIDFPNMHLQISSFSELLTLKICHFYLFYSILFFENYSKLSNSDKTRMFNYFLKALELLKSNNLIKSKVALVNKTIKEVDLKDVSVKELKETNKLKFYEN